MENSNNHNHTSHNESTNSSPRQNDCDAPAAAVASDELPPLPPRIRLMVSYNGRIQPRQQDNFLAYVGGENKLLAIDRSFRFPAFVSKLRALYGSDNFVAKYQLPGEELDSLISVTNDEDLESMMVEYERICRLSNAKYVVRLRMFLFNAPGGTRKKTSSVPSTAEPSPAATSPQKVDVDTVDYLFGLDADPNLDSVPKNAEPQVEENGDEGDSDNSKSDEPLAKSVPEIAVPPIQPPLTPLPTAFIHSPRYPSFVGGDGNLYYAIPATAMPAVQGFYGNMQRMPAPLALDNYGVSQLARVNGAAYGSRPVYFEGTAGVYQTISSNVE